MKFSLSLDSDNEAMQTGDDVARVLRRFAGLVESMDSLDSCDCGDNGKVYDDNGNAIGKWSIEFPVVENDDLDPVAEDESLGDQLSGLYVEADALGDAIPIFINPCQTPGCHGGDGAHTLECNGLADATDYDDYAPATGHAADPNNLRTDDDD